MLVKSSHLIWDRGSTFDYDLPWSLNRKERELAGLWTFIKSQLKHVFWLMLTVEHLHDVNSHIYDCILPSLPSNVCNCITRGFLINWIICFGWCSQLSITWCLLTCLQLHTPSHSHASPSLPHSLSPSFRIYLAHNPLTLINPQSISCLLLFSFWIIYIYSFIVLHLWQVYIFLSLIILYFWQVSNL